MTRDAGSSASNTVRSGPTSGHVTGRPLRSPPPRSGCRRPHDATAGTAVAGGEETVCHNDFSPLNVAFVDGLPVSAFAFDFDRAAPGPRARDPAHAAWLWLLGAGIACSLDGQSVLLRTFLGAYGLEEEGRRGFGERVGARGGAERDMRDRAGRVTSPGSWLRLEIDWPKEHADAIDRYSESRT
ncbi:phosphotransferase [Streptomyces olivaceoviridis]|uniref:phosphotransferase n=1 Tax=Streptomyces olivaceoviridis TaxID=1921 RepID=UPI0036796CA5